MLTELKAIVTRSRTTMIEDVIGMVSLMVILMAGLSLPALV
ncbi:hypothetical protein [Celeribacter marinus]